MIFVDTNFLIDVLAPDQAWWNWSRDKLRDLGSEQLMVIDQIVVAELASGFPSLDELRNWLGRLGVEVRTLSDAAAFTGGLGIWAYRRSDRERQSVLSDFLIGGHALHIGAGLLTRDPAIYRRYFPDLPLITPETQP